MELPKIVLEIINQFNQNGEEIYLVGGALRDIVQNKQPKDFDLATSATPEKIEYILTGERLYKKGKLFGTIGLHYGSMEFEITTFRQDGEYRDSRHPESVEFTSSLEEDLKRRDFTINAMAYHPETGLIDLFGGKEDLNRRVIRTVGSAKERLNEDALRILRGIRFAAVLDFDVDEAFCQAAKENASSLLHISGERIGDEMMKLLTSPRPEYGIQLMDKTDTLRWILPAVWKTKGVKQEGPFHTLDVYGHTLTVLEKTIDNPELRLAALYHDTGKPETKFLDERGYARFFGHEKYSVKLFYQDVASWGLSKKFMQNVAFLIRRHMACCNPYTKKHVKHLLYEGGEEQMRQLFLLQEADMFSTALPHPERIEEGRVMLDQIINQKEIYKPPMLAINGNDLKTIGFQEGKKLGACLKALYEYCLEYPEENSKERLLALAKQWKKGGVFHA